MSDDHVLVAVRLHQEIEGLKVKANTLTGHLNEIIAGLSPEDAVRYGQLITKDAKYATKDAKYEDRRKV